MSTKVTVQDIRISDKSLKVVVNKLGKYAAKPHHSLLTANLEIQLWFTSGVRKSTRGPKPKIHAIITQDPKLYDSKEYVNSKGEKLYRLTALQDHIQTLFDLSMTEPSDAIDLLKSAIEHQLADANFKSKLKLYTKEID